MKQFPGWLYEPLPYLYVLVGLITLFSLEELTGRMSGLLLIVAGFIIGFMRFQFRHAIDTRKRRKQRRITRHI